MKNIFTILLLLLTLGLSAQTKQKNFPTGVAEWLDLLQGGKIDESLTKLNPLYMTDFGRAEALGKIQTLIGESDYTKGQFSHADLADIEYMSVKSETDGEYFLIKLPTKTMVKFLRPTDREQRNSLINGWTRQNIEVVDLNSEQLILIQTLNIILTPQGLYLWEKMPEKKSLDKIVLAQAQSYFLN